MTRFDLYQATGLTPDELAEVFQSNPRAYMAVRGAVSEKHLAKIVDALLDQSVIDNYRTASGDMDKDFFLEAADRRITLECKNVEVIKTNNKKAKLDYIEYLANQGYLSTKLIELILKKVKMSGASLDSLSASSLSEFFKYLPQHLRESGLPKYEYSSSKVIFSKLGEVSDEEFLMQFENSPITIDFKRTRNSTDGDGDTRRNRYYRVGEIDIVGACLFARTLEWKFLYAHAINFDRSVEYPDRYANKLVLQPGVWTSNLAELIRT